MLLAYGTQDLHRMLSTPASAAAAAKWLVRSGTLGQFAVATEIEEEAQEQWAPFNKAEN